MSKLRNLLLSGAMATTLTACGGGGGGAGGAVSDIKDWVNDDLTNLSLASSNVSDWASIITDFELASNSASNSSLSALITGPTAEDQASAQNLLDILTRANEAWNDSHNNISKLNDAKQFEKFNDADYKKAYQAIQFLNNNVKPLLEKVAGGQAITVTEFNSLDKKSEAEKIINSYDAEAHVAQKIIKSSTPANDGGVEIYKEIEDGETRTSFSSDGVEGTKDWAPIQGAGGKEERTVAVFTGQTEVRKVKTCSWTNVVKLTATGSKTFREGETCNTETFTTEKPDKKELVVQTREGDNPIVETEILEDVVSDPTTEWNSAYGTDGVHTDPQKQDSVSKTETVAGSESTNTEFHSVVRIEATGTKNQVWKITDQYKKTTVTKPAVKTTYDVVTYKDIKTKQKRTWTITTKRKKVTYKDGTSEIIETPQAKVYTDWEIVPISDESRTVKENEKSENIFLTPEITDVFVQQLSKVLKNNAYTDDDEDLGTKTTLTLQRDSEDIIYTNEFHKDTSKSMINADKAYARGWTGKGAVLGVIDSYQQTDHEALDGKYKWYNNYVRYEDGTIGEDGQEKGTVANGGKNIAHGTHVAGIIAGKRDGDEFKKDTDGNFQLDGSGNKILKSTNNFHGVAFDAELVGANVDYQGFGNAHMSYASQALQDITKLKAPKANGGEGMNIVAINMSFNKTHPRIHYGNISTLSDGTYSASAITNKVKDSNGNVIQGDSKHWQVATDNDIILVNSAGNGLWINNELNNDFSLDPGIWATEVDSSGNLILGGKMIIVGNWGGTKADGMVVGSKAGHVCLDIVANKCNDPYKVSDFYILAPGNSVYSSASGDGYLTMGGSSMAAPQVTGALGILHQMWPHMKGENLVKLVLNTADKNINGYNVNIHGQGMLDLDEATLPQGALGIPTDGRVDGTTIRADKTYFATGNTSAFSSLSNLKIMVIDDYDRDYYMNLGSGFTVKDNRKYSDIDMLKVSNNTFLPINQSFGSFTQGGQYDLANNYNFGLYTGDNGGGDYSMNVGKNFMLHKNLKLKTSIGQMSEQDTWLGNYSDGALAVGDNNDTNFGNIGIEYALGNNVLSLDYTKGYTDINTTDGSLIKGFSDIETESYRLAYEIHKDKHTTFGWSFSLPSHITSGSMDLEVAESVNLDGTLNYTNFNSDLKQSTKEKNVGFFYSKTPEHDLDATFNFSAEYRQDVSGQDGKDGVNLALNYVKKFNGACGFFIWKNPKCYNADGSKKDMKALYAAQGKEDQLTKHGLVYDLETDMFVPIKKK